MFSKKIVLNFSIVLLLAISLAYYTKEEPQKNDIKTTNQPIIEKVVKKVVKKKNKIEEKDREINQIRRFFSKGVDKFPIVDTITYTSRVSWLKGRPAWIADYASYYETSRHFIARGLNGKEDYISQNVSPGDTFNVLKKDKNISFYLLVDLEHCSLDFSYIDNDTDEKFLIKNYQIDVGRKDSYSPSGCLTPLGKFKLGEKIAIYKEGVEGYFQNKKTHMIEIFGTRWIPFGEEIENCTDSAKGYGIHGLPFVLDEEKNEYKEIIGCLGSHSSDGCIRLAEKDINEIFSIVITRETIIEIVKEKNIANTTAFNK